MFGLHAPDLIASETDSFTERCAPLEDATQYLSRMVNTGLDNAVRKANDSAEYRYLRTTYPFNGLEGVDYCNSKDIYREIRHLFARKFIGQMEAHINHLPDILARTTDLDHSVYRDFPFEKSPTLVGTKTMGAVVRIGNHIIGADKFGHFFSEGWTGYKLAYQDPTPDFFAAVKYGEITEGLYYGLMTTGIYSHADLVANFNGMRFYNAVLGNSDDPLGRGRRPEAYVRCLNKKWERIKDFDWQDYVDAGWDEGVNFNYFRDEDLLLKAMQRMDEALKNLPDDCDCLSTEPDPEMLTMKYMDFSDHLLNLSRPSIIPDSLKPETLIKEKIHHAVSRMFLDPETTPPVIAPHTGEGFDPNP